MQEFDRLKDAGFSHLAKQTERDYLYYDSNVGCELLYNTASSKEWERVFGGVIEDDILPIIELEFVKRLDKAVQNG